MKGKNAFSDKAYAKMAMHALKFPNQAVGGVLVGTSDASGTVFLEAFPLGHSHFLGPTLKVAFTMIEEYCKACNPPLQVLAFYQAEGAAPTAVAKQIVERIAAHNSGATVWDLDASKLESNEAALTGYNAKDFAKVANGASLASSAFTLVHQCIEKMTYLKLIDFDDHFNDVSSSWLNENLFEGLNVDEATEEE